MLASYQPLSPPLPRPFRRRFAAGIDVSAGDARLAVLSRGPRRWAPVRLEWLGAVPLDRGAMEGGDIVDRGAVARAIAELFAGWPQRRATGPLACAMAVPGSAMHIDTLALPCPLSCGDDFMQLDLVDAIEPAVYAHAERMAGVDREALSVDWFVEDGRRGAAPAAGPTLMPAGQRLTIAAARRQHLEARVEAAAAAGIALRAVDTEPSAALRAICHMAACQLDESTPFAALWVGGDGIYGWRVADETVETAITHPLGHPLGHPVTHQAARPLAYPAARPVERQAGSQSGHQSGHQAEPQVERPGGPPPRHDDPVSALRRLTAEQAVGTAFVGGDIDLLAGYGLALADVADALGCEVRTFECASFADAQESADFASPRRWARAPVFAVACGLALRGVQE